MRIRLDPADCARYGVPEAIDFDPARIGLREAAALQRATGLDPDAMSKALAAKPPDLDALAALVWLAVGRAAGKRPDWETFDVNAALDVEAGDEGKEPSDPAQTSPI